MSGLASSAASTPSQISVVVKILRVTFFFIPYIPKNNRPIPENNSQMEQFESALRNCCNKSCRKSSVLATPSFFIQLQIWKLVRGPLGDGYGSARFIGSGTGISHGGKSKFQFPSYNINLNIHYNNMNGAMEFVSLAKKG